MLATTAPTTRTNRLKFDLPAELEAGAPPEARGMTRDAVRMMVAYGSTPELTHSTFALLPAFLDAGRPRRGQHVGHDRRRGDRDDTDRRARGRPPLDPTRRRSLGRRAAATDGPHQRTLARRGAAARAAARRSGVALVASSPTSGAGDSGSRRSISPNRCSRGSPCTAGRSGTATSNGRGRSPRTRTST